MLDRLPPWLLLPLLLVGLIALMVVPTILVALWERRLIRTYIPAEEDAEPIVLDEDGNEVEPWSPPRAGADPLAPTDYALATNRAAGALGFERVGVYRDGKGRIYKLRYDIWVSPDRETLAVVGGGTIASIPLRATWLHTLLADGRCLTTTDHQSAVEADPLGMIEWKLVANADFEELLGRHRARVAESTELAIPFDQADPLEDLMEFRTRRIERMGELGLTRFLDDRHDAWKYTLKGAFLFALHGYTKGFRDAGRNAGRAGIARPGDPGFVSSKGDSRGGSRALQQIQSACWFVLVLGGVLSATGGRAKTPQQAIFHLSIPAVAVAGLLTTGAIKLARRGKAEEPGEDD